MSTIPGSESSIYNCGRNGFFTSETPSSDRHQIPPCSITPDSETSISSLVTNGSVTSATETVITNHDVANNCHNGEGSAATALSQSADVHCIVQKMCCFCRKQFHSYTEMMKHVEESHTGQNKAFKCPDCDREFAHRDSWEEHCGSNTGVKPHSCPVCWKPFTQLSCLEVHMTRIHTGEKPRA